MKPMPGYIIAKVIKGEKDGNTTIEVVAVHKENKDIKKGDKIALKPEAQILQHDNMLEERIIQVDEVCAIL